MNKLEELKEEVLKNVELSNRHTADVYMDGDFFCIKIDRTISMKGQHNVSITTFTEFPMDLYNKTLEGFKRSNKKVVLHRLVTNYEGKDQMNYEKSNRKCTSKLN